VPTISLKAYRDEKRKRWKEDILAAVGRELDKVHESNLEAVGDKVITYAKDMAEVYNVPDMAKAKRKELERLLRGE